jgi:Mu-like prophage I protein/NUDIX domain-containing protein/uncharacterized protein DUF6582
VERAALVLVVRDDGKVLAVSRGRLTHVWGIPGGHVEAGETYEAAAVRELREETGLALTEPVEVFRAASPGGFMTATFTGQVSGDAHVSSEGDVDWVDRSLLTDPARSPFAGYARALFEHIGMNESTQTMDLGVDDVHQPGALQVQRKRTMEDDVTMSDLSAAERKKLKPSQFADPANRAYPIHDKKHADNAASRLEGEKASLSPGKYARIKSRIKAAQRRFGESPKLRMSGRGLRLSIDHPTHGRIEVRQMKEGQVNLPGIEVETAITLAAKDSAPQWNQIAKPGRYFKDGSFFSLDQKVFSDVIRNFDASENKKVPVDFEHASEMRGSDGTIPILGAPAHGWITKLQLRDGNLYGLVEWDGLAKDYIENKNYRFLSPAIRFGCKDAHTGADIGARLTSAALTNIPFLDGMQAVAAKDAPPEVQEAILKSSSAAYGTHEYMPRIKAALRLSDGANPVEVGEHFDRLRACMADNAYCMDGLHDGYPLSSYAMPLRELVAPPLDSSWDDIFDIVDDKIDAAIDEHNLQYHSGSEPAMPIPEEQAMSDKTLELQLKDAETDKAKLGLQLKELGAKLDAATVELTKATEEIKTLKDAASKRVEADFVAKVDSAFAAYKDAHKLTDAHKRQMLLTLKDDPKLFDELYPAIDPSKQYLMRSVVAPGDANAGGTTVTQTTTVPGEIPDQKTLIAKYTKEGRSLEDAVGLAYQEATRLMHEKNGFPGTGSFLTRR